MECAGRAWPKSQAKQTGSEGKDPVQARRRTRGGPREGCGALACPTPPLAEFFLPRAGVLGWLHKRLLCCLLPVLSHWIEWLKR